jgi:hypothetical protein
MKKVCYKLSLEVALRQRSSPYFNSNKKYLAVIINKANKRKAYTL